MRNNHDARKAMILTDEFRNKQTDREWCFLFQGKKLLVLWLSFHKSGYRCTVYTCLIHTCVCSHNLSIHILIIIKYIFSGESETKQNMDWRLKKWTKITCLYKLFEFAVQFFVFLVGVNLTTERRKGESKNYTEEN